MVLKTPKTIAEPEADLLNFQIPKLNQANDDFEQKI
jgi:hypothetical protein